MVSVLAHAEPVLTPTPISKSHATSHIPSSVGLETSWFVGASKIELLSDAQTGNVQKFRWGYRLEGQSWFAGYTNQQASSNSKLGIFSNEDGLSPSSLTELEAGLKLAETSRFVLCTEAGTPNLSANLKLSW